MKSHCYYSAASIKMDKHLSVMGVKSCDVDGHLWSMLVLSTI